MPDPVLNLTYITKYRTAFFAFVQSSDYMVVI